MASQYYPSLVPSLVQNWQELCVATNLDNQLLLSSFLRYRINVGLANAPQIPQFLGDHLFFMRFLRGIFEIYLNNVSILINVSPVLFLFETQTNNYSFLYGSTNFYFFENAIRVHDEDSKNSFFSRLSNMDLHEKIQHAISTLSQKYDGVQVTLVSLFFRWAKCCFFHNCLFVCRLSLSLCQYLCAFCRFVAL